MEFIGFPKLARLSRECVITEKIDGTNAYIYLPKDDNGEINKDGILIGSKNRWITPQDDNYGFAKWCYANLDELCKLGYEHNFGEWWGKGIQRTYDLDEKRFTLFNPERWTEENVPSCCSVVPVLYKGMFDTTLIQGVCDRLASTGSVASGNWFSKPEGIVIYHTALGKSFKKTIDRDECRKGHK